MKRRIIKVLKWAGLALVVLAGILLLLPYFFKDEIIQKFKEEVNNNLNARVDFGDFSLSMIRSFPDLNLTVNDIQITGVDTFARDTLFFAEKLRIRINLWSVTKDQLIIHEIGVIRPSILAKVLKDGRANWNVLKESEAGETDTSSNFSILLRKFYITEADVIYNDLESDIFSTVQGMDFKLKTISKPEQKYKTETTFRNWTFEMEDMEFLKDANAKLIADIQTDAAKWKLTFLENTLWLNEMSFVLDGFFAMPDEIEMDLGFKSQKSDFKGLLSLVPLLYKNDFEKLNAKGSLILDGKVKGVYNSTSFPFIGAGLKVDNGEISYEGMPDKINKINLNVEVGNIGAGDDQMTIDLHRFSGSFAGNPVNLKLHVAKLDTDPYVDGLLKGKLDLTLLTRIFPLEGKKLSGLIDADVLLKGNLSAIEKKAYNNFDARGFVKGSNIRYQEPRAKLDVKVPGFSLTVSPAHLAVSKWKLIVGKSDFSLDGKVFNYLGYYLKNEPIEGSFTLVSRLIDANELLALGTETPNNEKKATAPDTFALKLPVNADLAFSAQIDQLLYEDIRVQQAQGNIRLSQGKLFLDKFRVNMLKGVVDISGTYATKDLVKPEVQIKLNMDGIDIGETFRTFNTVQTLAPIAEKSKGLFDLDLDFKGKMEDLVKPDLSTLTGTCKLRTNHLEIEKSEVFRMISKAVKSEKFKNLALKDVRADIIMIDGKFKILPFLVKSNKTNLLISGDQGLDGNIDYLISFDVASEEMGKDAVNKANQVLVSSAGRYGIDLKVPDRIRFDALVRGTLKKPTVQIDIKRQAEQLKEKVVEQAKDKIQQTYAKARDEAVALAQKKAEELMVSARSTVEKIMSEASKAAQQVKDLGEKSALKIIEEADKKAAELILKAGTNPVAKIAAEEGARKIRKEARTGADKVRKEAEVKAEQGIQLARKQADEILAKAKKEGDDLIENAKNTSLQM